MRDWSKYKYGLNDVLVDPPVKYGDMDNCSRLLYPRASVGGVDFQDCFLRWLVSPARRRFLGVRRPVSGRLSVYSFLPFGLGLSPGWNGCCVMEILRISRLKTLSILRTIWDWWVPRVPMTNYPLIWWPSSVRLVIAAPASTRARVSIGGPEKRFRGWAFWRIPITVVRIEDEKLSKCMTLRREIFRLQPDSSVSARSLLYAVSFLDVIQWIVPCCFCHLRRGRTVVNDSGINELRRSGDSRAETQVVVTGDAGRHVVVAEITGLPSSERVTLPG